MLNLNNQEGKRKSEIHGQGYGDNHTWIRGETNAPDNYFEGLSSSDKYTEYVCDCGAFFRHFYDLIPDIFEAIKASNVSEKCPLNNP